ncbi:MAG: beta-propeller domain-containing protein [Actinomycetota bacterium]|nr:beta-propeller domain-containing protein [Actinomycetota bacterium]
MTSSIRRRAVSTLATLLLGTGLAGTGLVGTGLFVAAGGRDSTPTPRPTAYAGALRVAASCSSLLESYVAGSIGKVGPYGWNPPPIYAVRMAGSPGGRMPGAPSAPGATAGTASGQAASATGTNTQESSVDEPDVAKTDGRLVVRLVGGQRLVLTDVTGAQPQDVGSFRLPVELIGAQLLLVGHHVVLVAQTGIPMLRTLGAPRSMPPSMPALDGGSLGNTRLVDLDISDPARPRVVADATYSGTDVSVRQYGDVVRVVTSTGRPQLSFVSPGGPHQLSLRAATRRNQWVVRHTRIGDWLPSLTDNLTGRRSPLVGCGHVYRPSATESGEQTVAVSGFSIANPTRRSSVAVIAAGENVYSSADRLYVTSTAYHDQLATVPYGRPTAQPTMPQPPMPRPFGAPTTRIHAFALDGTSASYVGSGSVRGTVKDRWSLDEYAGTLRVAVTRQQSFDRPVDNAIVVLAERNGRLLQIGRAAGLGRNESLQSVRWLGSLAVLVTYRQVDPLYAVDLTDPAHPRELGELKVTGFSGYLHPIGGHRILALGIRGDKAGANLGAQAAVYDVGDATHPRRVSTATFGAQTDFAALQDPHQFAWLPGASAAVTSMSTWSDNVLRFRMVLLRVGPSGMLTVRDLPSPGGEQVRALPLGGGRVALVGSTVRLVPVG